MAFMMKKKRYKFQADLCLDELTEVSYSKAILFAKVRQLDGGSFTDMSRRYEVLFNVFQKSVNILNVFQNGYFNTNYTTAFRMG